MFLQMYIFFKLIYKRFYRYRFVFAIIVSSAIIILYGAVFRKEEFKEEEPWYTEGYCHISRIDDALPEVLDNVTFPEKSIFFHETSCNGGLSARQACSVEAAALIHPGHQINVFFTSSVPKSAIGSGYLKTLTKNYDNVKLARVNIKNFTKKTPLELQMKKMRLDILKVHISKIMRYVTLYKYSGIYLGLDVIVARPLDELWTNWAIREAPHLLSTDIFSFSQNRAGRKLAQAALGFLSSELSIAREHDSWSYSGPSVLTHLLQHWCVINNVELMSLTTCDDLAVYGPELFYPISFHDRKAYFQPNGRLNMWKYKKVYTFFLWERFTKHNIMLDSSLYAMLAKKHCPRIYSDYWENFSSFG